MEERTTWSSGVSPVPTFGDCLLPTAYCLLPTAYCLLATRLRSWTLHSALRTTHSASALSYFKRL